MVVPAAMFRSPRREISILTKSTSVEDSHQKTKRCLSCPSIVQGFKSYFHPGLANVRFIIHLFGVSTVVLALDTIYIRSAARAESVGIDPFRASLILAISAPFSAVGRAASGFIARCVLPRSLFGGGLVSGGVATILSGLFAYDVFEVHTFFCAWFALSNGESE